jgi:hypothetical protein
VGIAVCTWIFAGPVSCLNNDSVYHFYDESKRQAKNKATAIIFRRFRPDYWIFGLPSVPLARTIDGQK